MARRVAARHLTVSRTHLVLASQLSTLARAFLADEESGIRQFRALNATYVMIMFGGMFLFVLHLGHADWTLTRAAIIHEHAGLRRCVRLLA